MNDLISRKAAIKAIRKDLHADKDFMSAIICEGIENVLNNLLAEDETHEKRGKWIKTRHGYINGMPIYKCSNCTNFRLSREDGDMIEHYYFTAQFPYCPCCGARMEGKG